MRCRAAVVGAESPTPAEEVGKGFEMAALEELDRPI
jgi:hypothetical protein